MPRNREIRAPGAQGDPCAGSRPVAGPERQDTASGSTIETLPSLAPPRGAPRGLEYQAPTSESYSVSGSTCEQGLDRAGGSPTATTWGAPARREIGLDWRGGCAPYPLEA